MGKPLRFFSLFLAVFFLHISGAHATNFTVDSTNDETDATPGDGVCLSASGVCTLRAAVQESNDLAGDDEITLPAGTYTLSLVGDEDAAVSGDLDITSNITITGAGMARTIIDGGGSAVGESIFDVWDTSTSPSASLNLNEMKLTNVVVEESMEVEDSVEDAVVVLRSYSTDEMQFSKIYISDNKATGIKTRSHNNFKLIDSIIFQNQDEDDVGGMQIYGSGDVTITNSTIANNSSTSTEEEMAAGPGGVQIYGSGDVTITNSTISNNSSTTSTGGIHIYGDGVVTITNSTVSNNSSTSGTGGIKVYGSGEVIITNSTVSGNTSESDFGGIYSYASGKILIYSSTITAMSGAGFTPEHQLK